MDNLKFAIVGCGRIAQRHAKHIKNTMGSTLVAVCDIVEEKANQLGEEYAAKAYYTIEEMLKDEQIDIVSICSPNGWHAQHSILSLKAGKHVLCEKPMAISVYDCGEMIKTAEKANKRLFVIKQNRYNPPVHAVKQLIEEGKMGKINSVQLSCFWNRNDAYYANSWKGTKDLDGGTLYTQFSHFVDLLYYLVGDVKEVKAFGANYCHQGVIEFEDTGVVILRFHNNAIGTINYTVNSYGGNMEGSLTIFGDKGTVKIGGQYLNELEYQKIENYTISDLPEGNTANNYGQYQGSMSNHDMVYKNVVDVLLNSGQITTNMFEGLKTVEIVDRIYNEIEKNG
ncbi:Gfo/Idh/MocA family protein [Aureispira anguillae]|uniref:Gfo/Idh/MocA family oxidoreductase n=1 Tax=Aureispira anguillae TaxID=2864201 RepID=A0A916DVR4_9BACT|nr:Gfo/Idh/MocA family oxidoreductase [Aureispira anguillae]BDS14661.1 Gfo/Idh/MocA family oxidoreductase [Aureispira anguillae]